MDRSQFVEDDNSMFGDPTAFDFIINAVKPETIIEIGSWKGHSANYMANQCKKLGLKTKVICVDTFLGGPEHWLLPDAYPTLHITNGAPQILPRFLGNVAAQNNEDMVFPFPISSLAGAEVLRQMNVTADVIFIDAGHSYADVVADIMAYAPLLSEGGVMWGDDYQYEPLARAVHDCAENLGVTTMVIARKWFFLNEALLKKLTVPNAQLRKSYDGWVHP